MEQTLTTEAQQLLEAAFAGKLDLDAADADQGKTTPADDGNTGNPEPAATPATTPVPTATAPAPAALEEQPGTPIASKSGGYTIPYDKLVEARTKASTLEAENATLKQTLTDLQAAADARQAAGAAPTQADQNLAVAQAAAEQGIDTSIFGDFSEEGLAKGVAQLVEQRAGQIVDAKLAEALKPYKADKEQTEEDRYYAPILEKHPDAVELVESAEFKAWKDSQPTYVRAGIEHAMDKGTNGEVIEVFDTFKQASGKAVAPAAKPDARAIAEQAMKNAQGTPPVSLSDMPGAVDSNASEADRVAALSGNPGALMDYMATLTPAQQNRLMNSVV